MRLPAASIWMALSLFVPVIASAQNSPPVADAGPDQFEFIGDSATLLGTATDDDGDAITAWQWAVETSPPGSTPLLFDPFSAQTFFESDTVGDHVLSLIAFDGTDWSLPDTVVITYVLNVAPTAVAAADPTTGVAPFCSARWHAERRPRGR
jgi:hypothetical protein